MTPSTFDTPSAARELQARGIGAEQAEAIVKSIRQSSGDHVTSDQFDAHFSDLRAHIDTELARLSAAIYRASWLQGAAIVGVLAGLLTLTRA